MYRIIGGDQREYGPISAEEIRSWAREGRVNGDTRARAEPDGPWQMLRAFPEFADAFASGGSAPTLRSLGGGGPGTLATATTARGQRLDLGECLGRAWRLYISNWGLLFISTLLVTVLEI